MGKLAFKAKLLSYGLDSIKLKLNFENPLSISNGEKADIINISFLISELFVSKESGKTIKPVTILTKRLPKQFRDEDTYSLAALASSTT